MAVTTTSPELHREEIVGRPKESFVPAVEVLRGGQVESVHYAAVAVVDHHGHVVASLGDPDYVTFSRSSLKPLQALATVMQGFPERFGLGERHLALACASHSGEPKHVQAAQEILNAINRTVADLQCGAHIPIYMTAGEDAIPPKSDFSAIHNNCSGKHSTMLALAQILGESPADYLKHEGRVQTAIRDLICEVTGVDPATIEWGVDGCSAPNYAMPLSALATGFARYAWAVSQPPETLSEAQKAGAKIARAMMKHPDMVSGVGRFDLQLVEASQNTLFCKTGAEGVECVGIPAKGWGVAVKIADGNSRAIGPLVVAILAELGAIDKDTIARLETVVRPRIKNVRGTETGEMRYVARFERR